MTEAEWLACTDPAQMLKHLYGKVGDRKLRLLACTWCRKAWHLLPDARSMKAVEVAEEYTDGRASEQERRDAVHAATNAAEELIAPEKRREVFAWGVTPDSKLACAALAASASAYHDDAVHDAAVETLHYVRGILPDDSNQNGDEYIELIRHFFGNPFQTATVDSNSLTAKVVELAGAIYDDPTERTTGLVEAFEEAGCTNDKFLTHFQKFDFHMRGCWAVDMVLGKH